MEKLSRAPFPLTSHPPVAAAPLSRRAVFRAPLSCRARKRGGSRARRSRVRSRSASAGRVTVPPAQDLPRGARFPGLARNVLSRVRDSPCKPTGGEFGASPKWPQGGAQLNDEGKARSLRDLFAEGRAWQAETTEAREPCGTRPAGVRATGPRKTAGGRGCSMSGGGFQAGGPEGRRHYKRNWPPRGCPQ